MSLHWSISVTYRWLFWIYILLSYLEVNAGFTHVKITPQWLPVHKGGNSTIYKYGISTAVTSRRHIIVILTVVCSYIVHKTISQYSLYYHINVYFTLQVFMSDKCIRVFCFNTESPVVVIFMLLCTKTGINMFSLS